MHANYPMQGKEKTFYRNVSFERNILQTTKNRGSHTIWENKTTKKGLISVFFKLITYQNFKTHAKHRSCTNIILLPKKSILRTFELVTQKNAKMYGKYPIWRIESTLPETCPDGFERVRHQIPKKYEVHPIWA